MNLGYANAGRLKKERIEHTVQQINAKGFKRDKNWFAFSNIRFQDP